MVPVQALFMATFYGGDGAWYGRSGEHARTGTAEGPFLTAHGNGVHPALNILLVLQAVFKRMITPSLPFTTIL